MNTQPLFDLLKMIKIDFTNAYYNVDNGMRLRFEFDLSPNELISFAKKDLLSGDRRGITNSITNSKRAIDCQTDRILRVLGINSGFKSFLNEFCDCFCDSNENGDKNSKLRIVNALGMAPALIVSEVRTLRNKLEHEYDVPSIEDCKRALDVAELFVNATEFKITNFWNFYIFNDYNEKTGDSEGNNIACRYSENASIVVSVWPSGDKSENVCIEIFPTHVEYLPMIRMFMHSDQEEELQKSLKYLLKVCKHPIPENKVKLINVA